MRINDTLDLDETGSRPETGFSYGPVRFPKGLFIVSVYGQPVYPTFDKKATRRVATTYSSRQGGSISLTAFASSHTPSPALLAGIS